MKAWDRSSVAKKEKFFAMFSSLSYIDKAFLSVSYLINLQLKAETCLTRHRRLKLQKTVRVGDMTYSKNE